MNENNLFLLAAAGFLVWLLLSKSGYLSVPAGAASANGAPPRTGPSTEAAIGGAIGAGACVAGAAALGAPQAGAALAPLCSAIGANLAPYAKEGAIKVGQGAAFVGKKIGQGAAFAAEKVYDGAKEVGAQAVGFLNDPINSSTHLAAGAVHVVDRGISMAYNNAPTTVKVALAPAYAATKIGTKAVDVATSAVSAGSGAVAGAAKSTYKAVSGLLGGGGVNCSVAQQPDNAAWCRGKYGMSSAPGSDAWARANGRTPVLSGAGST